MLDQRDVTGRAALHHAVADPEERHQIVQTLLAAKAQVKSFTIYFVRLGTLKNLHPRRSTCMTWQCLHACMCV